MDRDFPGIRIGPEPTTDKFVAIMNGPDERIIPGNALAMQGVCVRLFVTSDLAVIRMHVACHPHVKCYTDMR